MNSGGADAHAANLTHNLYEATQGSREELPLFLQFEHEGGPPIREYGFLGRLVGSGKRLAFLSKAQFKPRTSIFEPDAADLQRVPQGAEEKLTSLPQSSNAIVARFLRHCGLARGVDPEGIRSLTITRWKFRQDEMVQHFQVLLTSMHSFSELKCMSEA